MKKLILGLMMAFAATSARAEVISDVLIDWLKYSLDTDTKTATITGFDSNNYMRPGVVAVGEVVWDEQKYTVTSVGERAFIGVDVGVWVVDIGRWGAGAGEFHPVKQLTSVLLPNATTIGMSAFQECGSLTLVSLPNATTIGMSAFGDCDSLTSVSLPLATTIGMSAFAGCGSLTSVSLPNVTSIGEDAFNPSGLISVSLPNATSIGAGAFGRCSKLKSVVLSWGLLANSDPASWGLSESVELRGLVSKGEMENASFVAMSKCGDQLLSQGDYAEACAAYGLTPKSEPQLVQDGEIAVTKESIAAPSAGTVTVEGNKVQLGVTVFKTSDLTAEKKDWGKVKLTKDDIDVDADGNIIVNVPVDSASGFMVIQTKDAKIDPAK